MVTSSLTVPNSNGGRGGPGTYMVMILIMTNGRHPSLMRAALAAMALLLVALLAACGSDDAASDTTAKPDAPTIVATTSPIAALVKDLVGEDAHVEVLIPNNLDPHDFQASVKDAVKLSKADLIVMNGAELESGVEDAIGQAQKDGVPVFAVADHVDLVKGEEHGHEGEDAHSGEEHHHGAFDPHIWLDPVLMAQGMKALAPVVEKELSIDLGTRADEQQTRLSELHAALEGQAETIPAARRKLVTGHESLTYFSRRYGFETVGAVIPSLSSQAEASAAQVRDVVDTIRRERVPVIFSETGTPKAVAQAIAADSGAEVIPLNSHAVADDGSYYTTMKDLMTAVVDGLSSGG